MPARAWVLATGGVRLFGERLAISMAGIFIPNLMEARKTGNETAAAGALRTIASVQVRTREADRVEGSCLDCATSLAEPSQVGLIDGLPGAGTTSDSRFTPSGSAYDRQCSATPVRVLV